MSIEDEQQIISDLEDISSSAISNLTVAQEENSFSDADAERLELIGIIAELDLALIKYITTDCRILSLEQPQTWEAFHTSSTEYFAKFGNYSASELCEEFVKDVLPNIYRYDLSSGQAAALQLLDLNEEYKLTNNGYVRVQKSERLTASREPKLNIDYRVEKITFRPPVSPPRSSTNVFCRIPQTPRTLHSVVMPKPLHVQQGGYGFQYKDQLHVLLSAMLSDDVELYRRQLHHPKELHQRLRNAKRNFERDGRMPQNCVSLDELLDKTNKINNFRSTLARVPSVSLDLE